MINSLLIANRGEIAVRIMRTCQKLGIRTVMVYSEADAHSLAVQMADTAVCIGPAEVGASYLNMGAILEAGRKAKVDAIHPGFGFLAESSKFARACQEAGFVFIGPTPEAITAMADKRQAKQQAAKDGVPVLPGYGGQDQSAATLLQEAHKIGYPLMVKAAAGGGGRGMRLVTQESELTEALVSARREALQAFGVDDLLLERAILKPRHIEFQILGDQSGRIIHLGERECSIQRRHQKIIEETPSLALSSALRLKMGQAAVQVAKAVGYTNAGTVEFLVEGEQFYFLEMNTRLQVEHPVTELVTGLDLVEWQIRIAEGESLPFTQEQVTFSGHAVEVRLYAENPAEQFLPSTGRLQLWQPPAGENIRVDSGVQSGDDITVYYDPMIAKIVAYGENRAYALRRLSKALQDTVVLGLTTNLAFLRDLIHHPDFVKGNLHTRFIEHHITPWRPPTGDVLTAALAAAVFSFTQASQADGFWRNNFNYPTSYRFQKSDQTILELALTPAEHQFLVRQGEQLLTVQLVSHTSNQIVLVVNQMRHQLWFRQVQHNWQFHTPAGVVNLVELSRWPQPEVTAAASGSLRAPMPGSITAVLVAAGQQVTAGQPLLKLEAMKMEHIIRAQTAGVVQELYYQAGDTVEAEALLLKLGE